MNRLALFLASLALILPAATRLQAQSVYDDVGVIVNDNDTNSVAIGDYFKLKRHLRDDRYIHVRTSQSETINDSTFEDMRRQVENALTARGLTDSLNFLVTTKGVPLRVDRGNGFTNSSVDAELMLILGTYSQHIGKNTTVIINPDGTGSVISQPYFGANERFSRTKYGIYLVTRLTALTKEDVFSLIDRSGPFTLVDKDSALFVLDQDPKPIDPYYNQYLASASQTLTTRGWRTLLNRDSVYVTNQRNVIGYTSWGSNDHYDHLYTEFARPKNQWLPGSVAETYVSTSARNFIPGQTSGQSRIADLLAEGCTGASGYVFEPYSFSLTWPHVLFDRYTQGFWLAESFYMGNRSMSWMAIVVGDPKTSITNIPVAVHDAPVASATTLQPSAPNPFREGTDVRYTLAEAGDVHLAVYDALGREVAVLADARMSAGVHSVWFVAGSLPTGMYTLRLATRQGSFTQRVMRIH